MMKFLRSQSQTVLIVVLGVIGLGFLFYGNAGNLLTSAGGRAPNDFGRIDGEDLSVAQLYDAVRTTKDTIVIHGEARQLAQPGASKEVAKEAWRQLLLLHEADRMHIEVSDKELVDTIKSMPLFQKDGVFSPDVYKTQMAVIQTILHVPSDAGVDAAANTQATFEKIIRNDLRTTAVTKALFGNIHGSAKDVSEQYEKYYGPTTVSVVTFDPKSATGSVEVQPADIEKEYKDNPTNPAYRTKEKRKVDYVLYTLTPEELKLPDDQKAKAKNALGEKATKFALSFIPDPSAVPGSSFTAPDFQDEAKKEGLTPQTTNDFAVDENPSGLPPSPAFNNAAFGLSKDNTISKVVELDNGVAVLHLSEIQPSELRPLEEVKGDIQKSLQQKKAAQFAQFNAKMNADLIKSLVAGGKDFNTAATGMKLKPEALPPFVPFKMQGSDQRMQTIAYAATSLKPGEVSAPLPAGSDGTYILVHLDKRAPADPAGLADFETRFRESQERQLQFAASQDWAIWKSKQPGTHPPPELESYGSVE